MESCRHIIVGDIHGCLHEFEDLLKKISYNPSSDKLILLGDLIDRGPFSLEMVQLARQMNLLCVMGNHEYKFIKWFKTRGTKVNFYDEKDHYKKFTDEDVNYIFNMPSFYKLDDAMVVHGGVKPGVPISNQTKDDFMYIRYIDSNKKFISLKTIAKFGKAACDAHFWTEFGPFETNIIYGHNVHSLEDVRIDKFNNNTACYGLDTGVCFGGKLSAIIWETKEIVQVPSRKIYYKSDFNIE